MNITPTLKSVEDLYGKLEREAYRSFHATNSLHVADHLYNFCVTAHSLRDYFFEEKGIFDRESKKIYISAWEENQILVAVAEIANTAKHFVLRKNDKVGSLRPIKTQEVIHKESQRINIVEYPDRSHSVEVSNYPDYVIRLESGNGYDLYSFMNSVKQFWHEFLSDQGVEVTSQKLASLTGTRT